MFRERTEEGETQLNSGTVLHGSVCVFWVDNTAPVIPSPTTFTLKSCKRGTFINFSHQSVPVRTKGPQRTAQRTMDVVTPAPSFTATDMFKS